MGRAMPIEISIQTARRYVLGRRGLWPSRRWRGLDGTEQAMRAIEHLQLDPLRVVTRTASGSSSISRLDARAARS